MNSLGGVSIAIIGIIILVLILIAARFACRHPKVVPLVQKVKEFLFWNFLIRYFQASYLNFNFTALHIMFNYTTTSLSSLITSAVILLIQYSLVILIFYKLINLPLNQFQRQSIKKQIGNLYTSLDVTERKNVVFATMFYI